MFHGIIALEPGIEHPVGKNKIGTSGGPGRPAGGARVVPPEPVGNNRVKSSAVLRQPLVEVPGVFQRPARGAFQVNGNLKLLSPRAIGSIDADNLHFVSDSMTALLRRRMDSETPPAAGLIDDATFSNRNLRLGPSLWVAASMLTASRGCPKSGLRSRRKAFTAGLGCFSASDLSLN